MWFEIALCAFAVFGFAVVCDVLMDRWRAKKRRKYTRLTRGEIVRLERAERDRRPT